MRNQGYLLLVNVAPTDWCFKVDNRRRFIGRAAESQIRIPSQFRRVSRRHAEIYRDKSSFWLCDLSSRGGTQVNGVWLQAGRPTEIMIGDRLLFSDVALDLVSDVPRLAEVMAEAEIALDSTGGRVDATVDEHFVEQETAAGEARSMLGRLTPAELDVVLWICRGYSDDAELGRLLFRSPHTVRTQLGSILQKLGLHSRIGIVNWLKQVGAASRGAAPITGKTSTEIDQREVLRAWSNPRKEPVSR